MTVDLKQLIKKDNDLVQESIFPYMLLIAMGDIPKDDGGKKVAYHTWLTLLGNEATYCLMTLSKTRQRVISKKIEKITKNVIKKANPVSNYKELSVAISMAMLDLIKQNKILNTATQTVSICIKIIEEALDYGDWGDLKLAKVASNNIIKALQENNCFKEDLNSGTNIKS